MLMEQPGLQSAVSLVYAAQHGAIPMGATVFTKNRDRLLKGIASAFFERVLCHTRAQGTSCRMSISSWTE
jgi:hypothetical protein